MKKTTFVLVLVLLAVLAVLVGEAMKGNVLAIVVLAVLAAVVLMSIGATISLLQSSISAKREQANFAANARENLAIMAQMQAIQNQQNSQLLKQVKQLPEPQNGNALIIDDVVFAELED